MNNLNTVLIEGNLTRDPLAIAENSPNPGCKFYIANNRYRIGREPGKWEKETAFFPVMVFGRMGEACSRTLKKGRGVRVCGRLKQYTPRSKNGAVVLSETTTFILAEHVEFQPERSTEKLNSTEANAEPEQVASQSSASEPELEEKGLEGAENQISAEEIKEVKDSATEYEEANTSDADASNQEEPGF